MSKPFAVSDLANFDKLIAPRVLRVVYWIGLAGIALFALISFVGAFTMMQYSVGSAMGTMVLAVIGFCFAVLLWRVMVEIYLILFQIHDRLTEIRDNGRSHGPVPPV